MSTELDCIVMYLEFNPTRYINKDNWKHIMKYSPQSDVHRTEGRKLFSRKNNMLTNHDSNRNRNMSRTDEGKNQKQMKINRRMRFETHLQQSELCKFLPLNQIYALDHRFVVASDMIALSLLFSLKFSNS